MTSVLRRWIFLHTTTGEKFGRDITSATPEAISRAITAGFANLGGRRSWRILIVKKLSAWVSGNIDHSEATTFIKNVTTHGPVIGDQCFAAARIMAALGLFEASLAHEERGIHFLHRGHLWNGNPSHRLRKVQSAIHREDRDGAIEGVRQFLAHHDSPEKLPLSVLDLLHYVNVWANSTNSKIQSLVIRESPTWSDYVGGKKIVVYGPGNIHPTEPAIGASDVVARIAGPGSYSWQSKGDLAQGRANLVYTIPETLESLGTTPEERRETVSQFDFLCIKRGEAPYLPNSRKVEAGSRLFLRGHPNMVPLAVIDVLRAPGTTVRVIGSDFFASESSYRPDSIRTTPEGKPQTNQGSTGNRFDRSTLMASHNAFQNRRLVKNLLDSGRVTGDDAFLEACSLSDLDYARRLDLHYGQHRL